jgi:tRNA A22 N-methylase
VSITEIQEAILDLPETEYTQLREWLSDLDWNRWDQQIVADSEAGKLDSLVAEAREATDLRPLEEL